jgi:hypothetical protein
MSSTKSLAGDQRGDRDAAELLQRMLAAVCRAMSPIRWPRSTKPVVSDCGVNLRAGAATH